MEKVFSSYKNLYLILLLLETIFIFSLTISLEDVPKDLQFKQKKIIFLLELVAIVTLLCLLSIIFKH